jgi:predicted HNH restriction endonuclease
MDFKGNQGWVPYVLRVKLKSNSAVARVEHAYDPKTKPFKEDGVLEFYWIDDVYSFIATRSKARGRKQRLQSAARQPKRLIVEVEAFDRNPDVIAEVWERAAGICEVCNKPAPVLTREGRPYLEVHHRIRLSDGGDDTVENAIAVCPNCHREAHYG